MEKGLGKSRWRDSGGGRRVRMHCKPVRRLSWTGFLEDGDIGHKDDWIFTAGRR